jgi:hypothetical protein
MKTNEKQREMFGMMNIDMVTRLGFIIEQATKAEDYKLANELSYIQLDLIEERTRAWNEGFNTGYGLQVRRKQMKQIMEQVSVISRQQ